MTALLLSGLGMFLVGAVAILWFCIRNADLVDGNLADVDVARSREVPDGPFLLTPGCPCSECRAVVAELGGTA